MDTPTHIYIQKSHYRTVQRKFLYSSGDEFMESVEKYLDRNGIPFTLQTGSREYTLQGVLEYESNEYQIYWSKTNRIL